MGSSLPFPSLMWCWGEWWTSCLSLLTCTELFSSPGSREGLTCLSDKCLGSSHLPSLELQCRHRLVAIPNNRTLLPPLPRSGPTWTHEFCLECRRPRVFCVNLCCCPSVREFSCRGHTSQESWEISWILSVLSRELIWTSKKYIYFSSDP